MTEQEWQACTEPFAGPGIVCVLCCEPAAIVAGAQWRSQILGSVRQEQLCFSDLWKWAGSEVQAQIRFTLP
jgi:hypothetical protein